MLLLLEYESIKRALLREEGKHRAKSRCREEPASTKEKLSFYNEHYALMPRSPSVIFLRKCHLPPGGRLKVSLSPKFTFRFKAYVGLICSGQLIKRLLLEEKLPRNAGDEV